MDTEDEVVDPELSLLNGNKSDGYNYRERRQEDWLENYTLARDKVVVNRLTQRQTVNLPVMKIALRTLLKDVDDMPVVYFENLDNDKEAEVFKNEYWKLIGDEDHGKFEILDIIDKKQVFFFGRSYDQWQIIDGMPKLSIIDTQDMLVPRYNDPTNIDSGRFLIHDHIFVPLSSLEKNDDYSKEAIAAIKKYYASDQGLIKAADNQKALTEKNRRMTDLGVPDVDSPVLGETYVELTLHFVYREEEGEEEQLYLYVVCDDMRILMKKRLEEVIGVTEDNYWRNHFPYDSWADDVEKQDWYSDAVADIVRPSNKVVNAWFSQMVENRTLRNFGMHYFNSNIEGFAPQTYDPKPWGWYGVPVPQGGSLSDVMQKVDIPDLSESLDEMQFVIGMSEKASGATSTVQGAQTERSITLGEVELALGEAKERIKGMSKFYTQVWKERAIKFTKLLEAAEDKIDAVKVYKKGRNTDNIYSREIAPNDWRSESGYKCKVWSQEERTQQNTASLEKLNAVKANMPDNPKVDEIYKRKLVEFADLQPEEINEIMEFEARKKEMMMAGLDPMTGLPTTQVQNGIMLPPEQPAQQPMPQSPKSLMGGAR